MKIELKKRLSKMMMKKMKRKRAVIDMKMILIMKMISDQCNSETKV
jgi:hypothetical protein